MKRFSCPVCGRELHFDNSACLGCGAEVAYVPARRGFATTDPGPGAATSCANRGPAACNWAAADRGLCLACRHNRTIPNLDVAGNAAHWADLEQAKRYLFYSILAWNLPHPTRSEDPQGGLAFDFLADGVAPDGTVTPVMTGHDTGIVTLNIAEADDSERVARREAMGEPYRTLIGHMRHEVGHYYWEVLIRAGGRQDAFRRLFGDERADYGEALKAHYRNGPRDGWRQSYISSYAASHPWEDWAETWAHYFHIVDASETAHAFGMRLRDGTHLDRNPYTDEEFEEIIAEWVPLTVAVNSLNRSMGQPDLYPFVLSQPVEAKLRFIHDVVRGTG